MVHLVNNSEIIELPTLECNLIDKTGSSAGFNGVFLSYFLKEYDVKNALKYALCTEFIQKQRVGAVRSIPTQQENKGDK